MDTATEDRNNNINNENNPNIVDSKPQQVPVIRENLVSRVNLKTSLQCKLFSMSYISLSFEIIVYI